MQWKNSSSSKVNVLDKKMMSYHAASLHRLQLKLVIVAMKVENNGNYSTHSSHSRSKKTEGNAHEVDIHYALVNPRRFLNFCINLALFVLVFFKALPKIGFSMGHLF
jgi:hypothetical protein